MRKKKKKKIEISSEIEKRRALLARYYSEFNLINDCSCFN